MKSKILTFVAATAMLSATTSCIEEILPQNSTITIDQVASAPGAYDNAVNAITATLTGEFVYGGNSETYLYDIGLPGFYIMRDLMGQDVVYPYQNWFTYWYVAQYLGPSYRFSQLPWTYYYGWIKSCNEVINMAGENPADDQITGLGIAYAMRAYYYQDLARLYAQKPYALSLNDPVTSVSVPIVDENTTLEDLAHNPRATNEVMWAFILSDLDKAEQYLANYQRKDVYTPDLSVVYGLKARAYQWMEDWANAEKYAKLAQNGYAVMSAAEYTDWNTGFNTPNGAWMFGLTYKSDDPQILLNDADSSWGSNMCIEINPYVSGCGYAANYGQPFLIDRHLYETVPATDCRKQCYIDFTIDENYDLTDDDGNPTPEVLEALSAYSNHPDWLVITGQAVQGYEKVGGLPLKFRTAGGEAGRDNQYVGFVVAVPMMRVEEMKLIEAEAVGMQGNVDRGIQLLTEFAKTRDANYVYGTHNEAYYNSATSAFQNEIWWQRRIEFWGEGLATFDIKRLQKGVIRSYAGTNHTELYRYNSQTTPEWMNFCIVQTETNYNLDCTNNPDPSMPNGDSPEYVW